jgi:three-Cys-motif partner protein
VPRSQRARLSAVSTPAVGITDSLDLLARLQNEPGLLETHLQTAQKLAIMLRYWEIWCRIVARASGHGFCTDSLWLFDCFAGRGLHPSTRNPDGAIAGTPVQAFFAGVETKKANAGTEVHLRAVEKKHAFAQELERRLIRAPGDAAFRPDWRVLSESFSTAMPKILDEMRWDERHAHSEGPAFRRHDHRSLWLVDPHGVRQIPHKDLEPLQAIVGAEVIINLDLSGLWRVTRAALKALDEGDPKGFFKAAVKAYSEKRLTETWGSEKWRADIENADPSNILRSLAQSYANTFPAFEYRNVYALRGSRSQKRYVVHLTHSPVAAQRFAEVHETSMRLETVASGELLSPTEVANRAAALHRRFAGEQLSVSAMYELGVGASRRQIMDVCRAAERGGYGKYDDKDAVMTWFEDRLPDPTLGLLD